MKNFFRQFKYTAILMLNSKSALFWMVLYPIILSALFFFSFSSVINLKDKNLEKINVGVQADTVIDKVLLQTGMFNVIAMENNEADIKKALKDNKIIGFVKEDYSLIISENGIKQSITKSVLDYFQQLQALNIPISAEDIQLKVVRSINEQSNIFMIMFYSLLAMVSIYGIFGGMSTSIIMQANMSTLGIRISSTPLNRFSTYLSSILFYLIFNLLANIIYIAFVVFALKINFITDFGTTLLLLLFANLFGVTTGICIGSLPIGNESIKNMFAVLLNLFLAFLSGLMGVGIKQSIDEHFPVVNRINPIGLLTDNFYNINILQEYNLVNAFLILTGTISVIFLIITFFNSKKVQYKVLW